MSILDNLFAKKESEANKKITKEEIAEMLSVSPEFLAEFEKQYKKCGDIEEKNNDNFFKVNAKQASSALEHADDVRVDGLVSRIVNELLAQTELYCYDGKTGSYKDLGADILQAPEGPVRAEDILSLPEEIRPQLAGNLIQKDISGEAYPVILSLYKKYLDSTDAKEKQMSYNLFRQGLDIQDLDPVLYEIIGMNPNSIGNWFPKLVEAVRLQDFFKLPETTIVKVPLPLLQLTRLPYDGLTPTTVQILDRYCMKAFSLDEAKEYFIKTGTYSSKFDFRNARVYSPKEVREIGEYLLFIHFQALQMASPLSSPCIYGVSTTNEWCVREYISPKEVLPTIYHGLPLRNEMRAFIDFDAEEPVLGIVPYWHPEVMMKKLGEDADTGDLDGIHDYGTYCAGKDKIMQQFESSKDMVQKQLHKLAKEMDMHGQWSMDIMQNGNDFYIIDMALAKDSALKEYLPAGVIKPVEENWIPNLREKDNSANGESK